jgi:glutaredoxin
MAAPSRRARLRPRELVLYTRARCGVCRDAERRVRREVRRTLPWRRPAIRLVDVDADPEGEGLAARYGVRVPVIVLDGVEVSELELAPGVVRRALSGRRRAPRRAEEGGDA